MVGVETPFFLFQDVRADLGERVDSVLRTFQLLCCRRGLKHGHGQIGFELCEKILDACSLDVVGPPGELANPCAEQIDGAGVYGQGVRRMRAQLSRLASTATTTTTTICINSARNTTIVVRTASYRLRHAVFLIFTLESSSQTRTRLLSKLPAICQRTAFNEGLKVQCSNAHLDHKFEDA